MNIFFTSSCPVACAKYLDNKRVVKMALESAQMLCTALHYHGAVNEDNKQYSFARSGGRCYKPTHPNHPSNIWARETRDNFMWLVRHFDALCKEYTKRYGKVHKSSKLLNDIVANRDYIPQGDITSFANCAANQEHGVDFKHLEVHEAYTTYLKARWLKDKLPAACHI